MPRAFPTGVFLCTLAAAACGQYEVSTFPDAGTYYNAAVSFSNPTQLQSELRTIISANFQGQSYGEARDALGVLDRNPSNSSQVLLMYNRAAVSATWDNGVTWNREHVWPVSRLGAGEAENDVTNITSDLFNLRACNPTINSTRSNDPFGTPTSTGGHGDAGIYYFPGDADSGDAARGLFYMATRYAQLTLVVGNPDAVSGATDMGDLQALMVWHYRDGVDNFERRRNFLLSSNNSTYGQRNRNPYVDRPEFAFAVFGATVFGAGGNNAQLRVNTAAADGSSSVSLNLSPIFAGAALPAVSTVTLTRGNTHPTTFDVTATGDVTLDPLIDANRFNDVYVGRGQGFPANESTRTLYPELTGLTTTAGLKQGTITIDNTDLTSSAAGRGSADANDTITVTLPIYARANASFQAGVDSDAVEIDFGDVPVGTTATRTFTIYNLVATASFTAALDLDTVTETSVDPSFATDLEPFGNLPAGTGHEFMISYTPQVAGSNFTEYTLVLSDENLPGAANTANLVITAFGTGVPSQPPVLLGVQSRKVHN